MSSTSSRQRLVALIAVAGLFAGLTAFMPRSTEILKQKLVSTGATQQGSKRVPRRRVPRFEKESSKTNSTTTQPEASPCGGEGSPCGGFTKAFPSPPTPKPLRSFPWLHPKLPPWTHYRSGVEDCASAVTFPFTRWMDKSAGTVSWGKTIGYNQVKARCMDPGARWYAAPNTTVKGGWKVAPDIVDAISEPGQPCLDIEVKCGEMINLLTRTPSPAEVARAKPTTEPLFGIPSNWDTPRSGPSKASGAPNILFYMIDAISWQDFNSSFPLTKAFLEELETKSPLSWNLTVPETWTPGERVARFTDTQANGARSAETQPTMFTGKAVRGGVFDWDSRTRYGRTNFMKVAKEKGYGATASFYPIPVNATSGAELPWMGMENQTAVQYIHSRDENDGTTTVQPLNDVVHWNWYLGNYWGEGCVRQLHAIDHNNEMIEALFHPTQDVNIGPALSFISEQTCHSSSTQQIPYADYRMAAMLRRLEDKGALEDTIIIVGADHGPGQGFWNFDGDKISNLVHPLLFYVLPPSRTLTKATANVRRSYNDYVEKKLGRRPLTDETRKMLANIGENSKMGMRVGHADTHSTIIDLVSGSTNGTVDLKKQNPEMLFSRSLAVNYTEKAEGNTTELQKILRPSCAEMKVRGDYCRYHSQEDMLPLLKKTVVDATQLPTALEIEVVSQFVNFFTSYFKFMEEKIQDISRGKLAENKTVCGACIDFASVAPMLRVRIDGLWKLTYDDGTGGFSYFSSIDVPESISHPFLGERTLRYVGVALATHKHTPTFTNITARDTLLEFGASSVSRVTRTSPYKPDQDVCGAEAAQECGLTLEMMQWCACRAKSKDVAAAKAMVNNAVDDEPCTLADSTKTCPGHCEECQMRQNSEVGAEFARGRNISMTRTILETTVLQREAKPKN